MKNHFEKLNKKVEGLAIKADLTIRKGINTLKKPLDNNDGWGKEEVIGIAITLIIAGFVMVPQLREFASKVVSAADTWYTNTMQSKIFPTTMP